MITRIYVAGHNGMVGRAIVRRLETLGNCEIITRSRSQLDLLSQRDVLAFFESENIDQVYIAAAKVGGIQANTDFPAEFIYENLMIEANIINSAHMAGVQKLLFLGSSCIYPKNAEQPMREEALMTGVLEATNEPYAIAKIAGIKMCESYNRQYGRDYRSVMPSNLYGSYDNFHKEHSHVIPALLRRFHEAVRMRADEIEIWGSGDPMREFLHVDDMASACVLVMDQPRATYVSQTQSTISHTNVGTGQECSIKELAETIADITQFKGTIIFDRTKPDGTMRKLLDTTRLTALGWRPKIEMRQGLKMTFDWFVANENTSRGK